MLKFKAKPKSRSNEDYLAEIEALKMANRKMRESHYDHITKFGQLVDTAISGYIESLEDTAKIICPLCADNVGMEIIERGFLSDTRSEDFHEGHELCKANKSRLKVGKIYSELRELDRTMFNYRQGIGHE